MLRPVWRVSCPPESIDLVDNDDIDFVVSHVRHKLDEARPLHIATGEADRSRVAILPPSSLSFATLALATFPNRAEIVGADL